MRSSERQREILARCLLVLGGVVASLIVVETLLAAFAAHDDRFYVWEPGRRATFHTLPGTMPGVRGVARFNANSDGMRGDENSPEHEFKILAIGGSTTECLYLDYAETWPNLLEVALGEKTGRDVFVGNVGRSGHNSREHVYQLEYLLEQYPDFDLVLLLVGINDLSIWISNPEIRRFDRDDPAQVERVIRRAFSIQPLYDVDRRSPYYDDTRIWNAIQVARRGPAGKVKDDAGRWYEKVRRYRRNATTIRDRLPDLRPALEEYNSNIQRMIDIAQEHGVELVLMTQPVLWGPELSQDEEELLWFGGVGRFTKGEADVYYSVSALADGMNRYNAELLSICESRSVECIDLAAMLPKSTQTFFDDVHFNEPGARAVAGILVEELLGLPGISTASTPAPRSY